MNKSTLTMAVLISLTVSTSSVFADDGKNLVVKGNSKGATPCSICHGVDGAGQKASGFPKLAGMNAGYIKKQLHDFQSGRRSNPIMEPIAKALSTQDIKQVAEYYSTLQAVTAEKKADEKLLGLGKQIAEKGKWEVGMPACFSCHGDNAQGVAINFPILAGQHETYIKSQLVAWKNGHRNNDPVGLMKATADKLTDKEIDAVSAYLSTLAVKQ